VWHPPFLIRLSHLFDRGERATRLNFFSFPLFIFLTRFQ
jgi:hypothetical protein